VAVPDFRKVNRVVRYRTAGMKWRPAIIMAVGAGTNVDLKIVSNRTQTFAAVAKVGNAPPRGAGWQI
jgi:hypothetical protein